MLLFMLKDDLRWRGEARASNLMFGSHGYELVADAILLKPGQRLLAGATVLAARIHVPERLFVRSFPEPGFVVISSSDEPVFDEPISDDRLREWTCVDRRVALVAWFSRLGWKETAPGEFSIPAINGGGGGVWIVGTTELTPWTLRELARARGAPIEQVMREIARSPDRG